jgi:hypothetical protein
MVHAMTRRPSATPESEHRTSSSIRPSASPRNTTFGVTEELRARGRRWASHSHGDLESAGARDRLLYRIDLNEQTTREHQVGPLKIIVAEVP